MRNPTSGRCVNRRLDRAEVERRLGMSVRQARSMIRQLGEGPLRDEMEARLRATIAGEEYDPAVHNVQQPIRVDNRDVYDDNRCRNKKGVSRYPKCDGKEDPIMFERIRDGKGVCSHSYCYDVSTLKRSARSSGVIYDPITQKKLTAQQRKLVRRLFDM